MSLVSEEFESDERGSLTEPLLTAEQVARILSVQVKTIYDAVSKGRLPHVLLWSGKNRHMIRFVRSEIEQMIKERTVVGKAPS